MVRPWSYEAETSGRLSLMGPTTTLHYSPQCPEICGFCREKKEKEKPVHEPVHAHDDSHDRTVTVGVYVQVCFVLLFFFSEKKIKTCARTTRNIDIRAETIVDFHVSITL